MVADMDEPPTPQEELTTRIPEEADLVALCRSLQPVKFPMIRLRAPATQSACARAI